MNRDIRSVADVLTLLDGFFTRDADWWDDFYADRDRPVPFFVDKPDESLASYLDRGLLRPGRALDLGCGPGRNARYLAANGFAVDAVDLSPTAIAWGEELSPDVRFLCGDAFTLDLDGPYDLIHDSGCFHHLAPHRRVSYLDLLDRHLAKGGHLGFTGFAAGVGKGLPTGSSTPDAELYRIGSLEGGLAYTDEELRWIFADFTEVELRLMNDEPDDSPSFGVPFLWTALFRKD
ncbi:class I SAM-dependent methyltransferase [Actinophytocola sp.]|uniref:class I SAM-dependent methyltransferase n=1 Tax=Actinophytocola sp. TaxID=1872138 RepID=UPI002D34F276|nr:class I SAM-dependent methyltransferase [Actinophytocola sp.]HYQ65420.1 class I SAM-dependent methyltransferase [Actinophytocola sp.]